MTEQHQPLGGSEPHQPMDVYSDIRIPFAVAAWCRGHRYSVLAVELARKLVEMRNNAIRLAELERKDLQHYNDLKSIFSKIENADARDVNVKAGVLPKPVQYLRVKKSA